MNNTNKKVNKLPDKLCPKVCHAETFGD